MGGSYAAYAPALNGGGGAYGSVGMLSQAGGGGGGMMPVMGPMGQQIYSMVGVDGSGNIQWQAQQQQIQAHLGREVFLKKIVADLSLSKRWNLTGEQQALERLKSSMFVRLGEVRNPMTQEVMATIDIGVKGKRKENPLLGEIATSMAKETREYLGIGQ
jgi:hypothetical protein